jgi:uncharacterized protein (TIGR00255 family)
MTVNSMTAFARERDDSGPGSLVIEIRSVNHRYLDCVFKLPELLRALEPAWRQQLQTTLSRGKIEVLLRWQAATGQNDGLRLNEERVAELLSAISDLGRRVETTPPSPMELLQWPGVIEAAAEDEDARNTRANALFTRALATLAETRAREGDKLQQLIRERVRLVSEEVGGARRQLPALLEQQRQRLLGRFAELDLDADPGRLEQEMVILAQKVDVEEELDRLEAHIVEVGRVLDKGGPCGRRLDFLMQELNREANTLSSKSISSSTTQHAVELKVLIEQMREQIQNLE